MQLPSSTTMPASAAEQTAATAMGLLGTDHENKCASGRLLDGAPSVECAAVTSNRTLPYRRLVDCYKRERETIVAYLPRSDDQCLLHCI